MDPEGGQPPPAGPTPRPRRPKVLLPVLAVVAVGALAGALALTRPAVPPRPVPSRSAAVAETVVRTAVTERNAFVGALTGAEPAGITAWLDRHARTLPGVLARARRSDTLEFSGSGSRTLLLDPPSIGEDGGHVTVLVVTAVDARVTWTLLGDGPDLARGAVTGTRTAVQRAGVLTSAAADWAPGRRPGTLLVVAPDGVRWGVAAVFSD